jgi:hypothetical protein
VVRHVGLLLAAVLLAGCGTKTVTMTVTRTRTATVVTQVASPEPLVLVPDIAGGLVYKPDTIGLGASNGITGIRWSRYGGNVAVGRGRFPENTCEPNCADGTVTWVTVTVQLKDRVLCRGHLVYQLMSLDGPGFKVPFDTAAAVMHATRDAC